MQELPIAKNGAFVLRERELLSRIVGDPTVGNRKGREGKLLYVERPTRGYQI